MLVAIAIPVFTTQLERSREATDVANVRSAYAGVMTEYLTTASDASAVVNAQQKVTGWDAKTSHKLQGMNGASTYDIDIDASGAKDGGKWTISVNGSTGSLTIKGE